ncbi:ABC transporter substrate-binding protein [Virgibacillus sp. W0181]|uniref:ABC transporter substrate-binding protein n=1 Tax=Virgibacillus sp. W0181 TaxID=3391581 RepID=UPI003F459623
MKKIMFNKFGLFFIGALMVLLIGCAGISEESSDNSSEEPAENASEETGDSSEDVEQALKVAFDQGIDSLDPYGSANGEPSTVLASRQIYDTLVINQNGELKPSLAEDWEQPDPKTWVFHIKEGVTFHDGSPLTAKDVKYSLEQQVNSEDSPLSVLWLEFESAEATDDHTLTIKTKKPMGTMLSNLTLLFITPADSASEEFYKQPIGSGPFKVESFVPQQNLALTGNEEYWDGAPHLANLEFVNIPETAARLTALETGEIDVTWTIPIDQVAALENQEDIEIIKSPSYLYYFNWFNSSREPFDDPKVRQAMWYALDTNAIVEDLYGESGEVMTSPIPDQVFGSSDLEPYKYNPEKAKKLLEEAGYPDGFSTSMMWSNGGGPQILQLAETMMSYWSEIGVEVEPIQIERAEWIEKLVALDWDMDLQTNSVITGDGDYTLGRLYISEANRNGYKNEELDKLLIAAKEATDQEERQELYDKANKIIWEEAVGIFPLQLNQIAAIRSHVEGFQPSPSDDPQFKNVLVTK